MRKIITMTISLLFLVVLTACGNTAEENKREVETTNSESYVSTAEENNEVADENEESPIGTRSNPLPFGSTITVEDSIYDDNSNHYSATLDITLLESFRGEEAWKLIQAENEYNEPPLEGFEYALVKVKGNLKDAETENDSFYFSDMNFDFVSNEGEVYEYASIVIPQPLDKEMYKGATTEGYIVGQVRKEDDFKVSYESSEGSPVFFFVK